MSDEFVDSYGPYTLGAGQSAWFYVPVGPTTSGSYPNPFDQYLWHGISAFPTQQNSLPAKLTILQQDWEVDEWKAHVCWVLVKNNGPYLLEFQIASLTLPE